MAKVSNRIKNAKEVVFSEDYKRFKKGVTYYITTSQTEKFVEAGAKLKAKKIDVEKLTKSK